MSTIRYIAIHHTGGVLDDYFASTRHITHQQINEAHRQRWNFPSEYIPGQFGGYNLFYSPVDRSVHQFRAFGEETAAQLGHNHDTLSLCIGGNYTRNPREPGQPSVDPMTPLIEADVADLIHRLLYEPHSFDVVPGTTFDLSFFRVGPHRAFQNNTACYGSALDDQWISRVLLRYYKKKYGLYWPILLPLLRLFTDTRPPRRMSLGRAGDRACEGYLPDNL